MTPGLWAVVLLLGVAAAWLLESLWNRRGVSARTRGMNIVASSAMVLIAGATVIASQERTALIFGAVSLVLGLLGGLIAAKAARPKT